MSSITEETASCTLVHFISASAVETDLEQQSSARRQNTLKRVGQKRSAHKGNDDASAVNTSNVHISAVGACGRVLVYGGSAALGDVRLGLDSTRRWPRFLSCMH